MTPILIEQSPEETRLAFEVHRNSSIERVRLSRARATAPPMDGWSDARISVGFSFRTKELPGPSRIMRLEISFRMKGTLISEADDDGSQTMGNVAPEKTPEQLIAMDCAFEVDYALQDEFEPSTDQVKAFREGNAVFNVWPFFREYLHNQMQRMGLPPLTAPFLRIAPKQKHVGRRGRPMEKGEAPVV